MPSAAILRLVAYIAGAAALAGILWGAWGHFREWIQEPVTLELEHSRKETATARQERDDARAATARLEAAITAQNQALEQLEAERARLKAAGAAAYAQGKRAAERHYTAAEAMLHGPPLDADPCRSATLRARRYLEERRQ